MTFKSRSEIKQLVSQVARNLKLNRTFSELGFVVATSSSPLLQASRKLKPKKAKATVGHTSFKKCLLLFMFFIFNIVNIILNSIL